MKAMKSLDGKYRVSWRQAMYLTTLTRVTAADTGERLQMDVPRTSLLGGIAGAATASTVTLNFWLWLFVLDRAYGLPLLLFTIVAVLSIWLGISITASRVVTFTSSSPSGSR